MTEITLDYYLAFFRDYVDRLERLPIVVGHSMGGAIAQWYLRYVRDDLPAVVLVGAWVHDDNNIDGARWLSLDFMGLVKTLQANEATPLIRTPAHAAKLLISPHAIYSPEALHAKLSPESWLVMMHNTPPFWRPAEHVRAPMLCIGAEKDAVLGIHMIERTANYYGADFIYVPDSGHNIMMDAHYQETAQQIHEWLVRQNIL